MENKELRNLLVNNMKNELKDFAQVQRNLKKSRKLEFRPKDKSLQSICDEIAYNKDKISKLLFYYRWFKHGLKYWVKRDIHDFWMYQASNYNPDGTYPESYREKECWWNHTTFENLIKERFKNYLINKIKEYKIEIPNEQINDLIEYLY